MNRRTLPPLALAAALAAPLPQAATAAPDTWAYFGCIGKEEPGVYVASFDSASGELGAARRVLETPRSAFLAIAPDGGSLYAIQAAVDGGALGGYQINAATGDLTEINVVGIGSSGACHVCLTPDGSVAATADYREGKVASFAVASDGQLSEAVSLIAHEGSSIDPRRQAAPHAHSVIPSPDGRFIYAADLGTDFVYCYKVATGGKLTPNDAFPAIKVKPGGGPRHFTFHPSGKFAYTNNELTSSVTAFSFDSESGKLEEIQMISTLPDGFENRNSTSEILCHPTGKFLYVANRGHNSIAGFAIDGENGKLTAIGHESCGGEIPRNFGITPDGRWILTACMQSNESTVLAVDLESGTLKLTEHRLALPKPMCVRFVPMGS